VPRHFYGLTNLNFRSATSLPLNSPRRFRAQELSKDDARQAFSTFDEWAGKFSHRVKIEHADVVAADGYLRRLDLTLRTPDALHIAITQRLGIPLVTFDEKMETAARQLGTQIAVASV